MNINGISSFSLIIIQTLLITACGGGSSSSNSNKKFTINTPDSVWTQGVFANDATFKNKCETPRTGIDSYTGESYLDTAGSSMDEKMWLRSWSNDTYLWYNEIIDIDPTSYTVTQYFDKLITSQNDDSGQPKDNFHFYQESESYNKVSQGGVVSGYGIDWNFVNATTPRKLIVNYVENGSPADIAGVTRGLELAKIDDIDFINSNNNADVDDINNALFPTSLNQSHTFTFKTITDSEIVLSLSSANVEQTYVQNSKIISIAQQDFGYFQFNGFNRNAQADLIASIESFSHNNITDLVIDLRYNGGGLLAMSSQLAYMVAGSAQSNNSTFEKTLFNDKHTNIDPVTNETIYPTPFYDKEIDWQLGVFTNTTLPSLNLARVYILSSENTCSASEALINGLRGIDVEVILIGDTTCGKPYGFYPEDNCGTTYFTIQFKGVNDKGFGEYANGFNPTPNPQYSTDVLGCQIDDDYNHALGDENEALLAGAIYFSQTGNCPVNTQNMAKTLNISQYNEDSIAIKTPNTLLNAIIEENKIYSKLKPYTP